MKTVRVPIRSKILNDLLKKARDANVLLRSESGEQFVLAKVSSVQSFYVGDSDDLRDRPLSPDSTKGELAKHHRNDD